MTNTCNYLNQYLDRVLTQTTLNEVEWQKLVMHTKECGVCRQQGSQLMRSLHPQSHLLKTLAQDMAFAAGEGKSPVVYPALKFPWRSSQPQTWLFEKVDQGVKACLKRFENASTMTVEWVLGPITPAPMFAMKGAVRANSVGGEKIIKEFEIFKKDSPLPISGKLYSHDQDTYRLEVQVGSVPKYVTDATVRVSAGNWQSTAVTDRHGKAEFTNIPQAWIDAQTLNIEVETK